MSSTLAAVRDLVAASAVLISAHGYDQLADDDILISDVLEGVAGAQVVEDYPEYHKGPSVLVLQRDGSGRPVHVVWGIPRGAERPAVLVTAYRPVAERWTADFLRRMET